MATKKKKTTARKSSAVSSKKSQNDLIALLVTGLVAIVFILLLVNTSQNAMTPDNANTMVSTAPVTETRVILGQQNNSYESGSALLTEANGKTTVTISVDGEAKGASQPAHIHTGSCPTPGAVVYDLAPIVNGKSVTTLNVKLADLIAKLPLAINVHKSAAQIGSYLACGNLQK